MRIRLFACFFLLCGPAAFPATIGAALAAEAGAEVPASNEVLSLEEAARLLRVPAEELAALAEENRIPARRIGVRWRFSRCALMAWLAGAEETSKVCPGAPAVAAGEARDPSVRPAGEIAGGDTDGLAVPGSRLISDDLSKVTATGTVKGTSTAQSETTSTSEEPAEPIGEAPEERTAEEVFLRSQSVLLDEGEVTLEAGLFYSRSDGRELALVGSSLGLATIEEETITTALTGRYGLFDGTEVFASASYRYQDAGAFLGDQKISGTSRGEFGDVRLGLRQTVLQERSGLPEVIVSLEGRIPTEESSYALGGGVALVKSFDPVVLFANANYRRTFARDFSDVTRLQNEDRVDATLGYALALNDSLAISTAVSGVFLGETRFDNAELRQRELFSLQLGLTAVLTEALYIEPILSFGLNGNENSFVLGVSLPYTFAP